MFAKNRQAVDVDVLTTRARLLARLRRFFDNLQFVEVETPLLSSEVIGERAIEPVAVSPGAMGLSPSATSSDWLWLQSSPELAMKRLLVAGMSAIYQVTRSFRAGEWGPLHRPEYTIVEWYRTGDDMAAGIDLLDRLMTTMLDVGPARRISYAEAFRQYADVDPWQASMDQLRAAAERSSLPAPAWNTDAEAAPERDEWLNLLLTYRVEPQLGRDRPEIVFDFPASQAALAHVRQRSEGPAVAERFELYWQGVELANGYHELTDAAELRERLLLVNRQRKAAGQSRLPLPERLLTAIERGLPPCAGVALGFDRLVMLATQQENIGSVMAWADDLPGES